MPDLITVYHGTSNAFRVEIEDHGLRSRPGKTTGTRISLSRELAVVHAAAYCAYLMLREQVTPKGLICKAQVERSRIREGAPKNPLAGMGIGPYSVPVVGPALVLPGGIAAKEITFEEVKMDFLFQPEPARRALAAFERMTDQKIVLQPRRRTH